MAASPRRSSGPVLRSVSPAGRFSSSTSSSSRRSSPFASSTSTFASHCSSSTFIHRSSSPTRVNMFSSNPSSSSVRFSLDRSVSPNRSISMLNHNHAVQKPGKHGVPAQIKACMCSPTNHPGSFRCSLHRNSGNRNSSNHNNTATYSSNQLNMRRSAMTNSLVRIGTVEGELVKRALAALIRPSSHSQRRREDFKPRPSRLSVMSNAGDACGTDFVSRFSIVKTFC